MSVAAIAKKDFQDGIRSYLLWGLMALFLLAFCGWAWLLTDSAGDAPASEPLAYLIGIAIVFVPFAIVLVPLTGLVVSIKSIVRERELGTIKVLLSLPHSRQETVIGKFVGRAGLLTSAILVGFIPAGLLFLVQFEGFPLLDYGLLALGTVLFGLMFVAIGVGVSALLETETRATVAGIAVFFLLYLWQNIFAFVNGRLDLVSGDGLQFVYRLHLSNVFVDVLLTLFDLTRDVPTNASIVHFSLARLAEEGNSVPSDPPFYLQHWFAFVILALWIVVPLAIGYVRFEKADL